LAESARFEIRVLVPIAKAYKRTRSLHQSVRELNIVVLFVRQSFATRLLLVLAKIQDFWFRDISVIAVAMEKLK
jgi:hypothetical protein